MVACGLLVTIAIAFVSRPFGRVGAVVIGILLGLAPSILLFSWVSLARPGFEAYTVTTALATILDVPSAVGGAIAGLICSWPTKNAGALQLLRAGDYW